MSFGLSEKACPVALQRTTPAEGGPAIEHDPKGILKRLDGKSIFPKTLKKDHRHRL
jgi:hypothetical protein